MKPYYQDDYATIYHGDCRQALPLLCVKGEFDVSLTDPQYGIGEDYESGHDDNSDVSLACLALTFLRGRAKAVAITPGQKAMFRYPEPDAIGAFYYPAGAGSCSWGFVCWQPIFYYGKDPFLASGLGRRANSFSSTESAEKNGHPCPKPIGQWRWLLARISRPNEIVLDPFMGSGTTLVAAKGRQQKAIGIEIEEKYCEIAAKRLAQEVLPFVSPVPDVSQIPVQSEFLTTNVSKI